MGRDAAWLRDRLGWDHTEVAVRSLGPDWARGSSRGPDWPFLPLDWGMPAGWLGAGDSMVQAGPGSTAETNLEGSGLDPGGERSWLRAGGPGAAEEQERVE